MPASKGHAAFTILVSLVVLGCLATCTRVPPPAVKVEPPLVIQPEPEPVIPEALPSGLPVVLDPRFTRIDRAAQEEIAAGHLPGAVILVGHQGKIVYRRAFGHRALIPHQQPMTPDTIFDVASLTKVVATTTAVMQLVEQSRRT